jgi:hypothetical protein
MTYRTGRRTFIDADRFDVGAYTYSRASRLTIQRDRHGLPTNMAVSFFSDASKAIGFFSFRRGRALSHRWARQFGCRPHRLWVLNRKTFRNVTMVVPVLLIICHVSENVTWVR